MRLLIQRVKECKCIIDNKVHSSIGKGLLCYCAFEEGDNFIKMKLPVLRAVRHIVLAGYDRLYNFRVSDDTMQKLAYTAENYLIAHLERNFRTLDFYKSLI